MEARITFRSEIYIEGKDLHEIKSKWMDLNITPKGLDEAPEGVGDFNFVELVSAEDADTYEDLGIAFSNA